MFISGKDWVAGRRQLISLALIVFCAESVRGKVWQVDDEAKTGLSKSGAISSAQLVESILTRMQPGDALRLSEQIPLGDVRIGDAAQNLEIVGGFDGSLTFEGQARDWKFYYLGEDVSFRAEEGADLTGSYFFCSFGAGFQDLSSSGKYHSIGLGIAPGSPATGLAKITANPPSSTGGTQDRWGGGAYEFSDYGNKVTWMPKYYMSGIGSKKPQVSIKKGNGGKWLFAIEAHQGSDVLVMEMQDSKRMQLYSGSTEGGNHQTGGIYEWTRCDQNVLGMRRFFSNHRQGDSWYGEPAVGMQIQGGTGNIIHNHIGIGNPKTFSLFSTDPALQIWQSFFEDKAQIHAGTFQYAVTHEAMVQDPHKFTEPVMVDKEVILKKGDKNLLEATNPDAPIPPAFDFQHWMTNTPVWKTAAGKVAVSATGASPAKSFRQAAAFGKALIQAGADPSGIQASDAAFEHMLATERTLEVPAGRFRLTRPLKVLAGAALAKSSSTSGSFSRLILGAGKDVTVIVAPASVSAVVDLVPETPLAKTGSQGVTVVLDGIGIEGGEAGVRIPAQGVTTVMADFSISGLGKAAVAYADTNAWFMMPATEGTGCPDGSEQRFCNDAHLFENGEINGYDVGVMFPGFADKQGFRNVTFRNQKIAGILATKTNLFHGWIGGCKFIDINGPGVDLSGGSNSAKYGYYTQWVTMIEGCEFTNCGSGTRAALDYGLTDINMVANTTIKGTKPVKYGFLGSVATMSNVHIAVNATKAQAAFRNPRFSDASRTPGTMLHTVRIEGKMIQIMDISKGNGGPSANPADDYVYSPRMGGDWAGSNHSGIKWWRDGVYDWAFPFLIYGSKIDGEDIGYELRNGKGIRKGIAGHAIALRPGSLLPPESGSQEVRDLRGRMKKDASQGFQMSVPHRF